MKRFQRALVTRKENTMTNSPRTKAAGQIAARCAAAVLALLCILTPALPPAGAAVVRAPSFVDWFIKHMRRVLSEVRPSPEQNAKIAAAKKPLAAVIEAAVRAEKERLQRLRDHFSAEKMTVADWEEMSRVRRKRSDELEARLRHEGRVFLVAFHAILTPDQRKKVIDFWASRVERRTYRYERPLQ